MPPGHEATTRKRIRKPRGRGLRTRTGCANCRRRHVKCDESKPECSACIRIKQRCSFTWDDVKDVSPLQQHLIEEPVVDQVEERENQGKQEITPGPAAQTQVQPPNEPSFPATGLSPPPSDQASNVEALPNHTSPNLVTPRIAPASVRFDPGPAAVDHRSHPEPIYAGHTPTESWAVGSVSSIGNVETDTANWFGLLFEDAALENSILPPLDFESGGLDIFGNSIPHTPLATPNEIVIGHDPSTVSELSRAETSNTSLLERVSRLGRDQLYEKQSWHSYEPVNLLPEERFLFQHFTRNISQWLDFFDPKSPFSTFVPHLAMHNVGLMNSILALSVRHLSTSANIHGTCEPSVYGDAVQYYYKTLHYIQKAMEFDTYRTSLELLATALVISSYEMLDGSRRNWEKHLKGVFWIQRSQVIHGDSKGLRSAVWWAWLCQDVWAAFQEKRKPFTFWKPVRTFDTLDPHELASRSVHLYAQVLGYCSKDAIEKDGHNLGARIARANELFDKLEEWHKYLTIEFEPMPLQTQSGHTQPGAGIFEPIWIHPPAFAVAIQLYYCSRIMLLLHQPHMGDFGPYMQRRRRINRCIDVVCGIAITLEDTASAVMTAQCVYMAAIALEDTRKREAVLDILKRCRERSSWPVIPLEPEMIEEWEKTNNA